MPDNLVIYGFGKTGKAIVDALLEAGHKIPFILDANKAGEIYQGIQISSLELLKDKELREFDCLIALHNHYVDLATVHSQLRSFAFKNVISLINLESILNMHLPTPGYWLDYSFSYPAHEHALRKAKNLMADDKSAKLFQAILDYRITGDIYRCPSPSMSDEYVPVDLPRYHAELDVVDCGAHTGTAIDNLVKAGYSIRSLVAFEPDLDVFKQLAAKQAPSANSILLPLGVWSENKIMNFESNAAMSSAVSASGGTTVQCVRIDDVIKSGNPNLVKFDVEGAEIEALKGMEQLIRRARPNLCVSVYHDPTHLFEIPLLIASWNLGYSFHLRVHEYNTFGVVLYCRREAD